jgi:hypothetical protein
MFSNYFYVLILKIKFEKINKYYFNIFPLKKTLRTSYSKTKLISQATEPVCLPIESPGVIFVFSISVHIPPSYLVTDILASIFLNLLWIVDTFRLNI